MPWPFPCSSSFLSSGKRLEPEGSGSSTSGDREEDCDKIQRKSAALRQDCLIEER